MIRGQGLGAGDWVHVQCLASLLNPLMLSLAKSQEPNALASRFLIPDRSSLTPFMRTTD